MKPQKKAAVARKATKMSSVAKKRRSFLEKSISDIRKEKKPKKLEKAEDTKRKVETDKKKSEKSDDKKKVEERKKGEEKRKEKSEKMDEKKKCIKDNEKKCEKIDEKKLDKIDEKVFDESPCDGAERKKVQKVEEKGKLDKLVTENKKKSEKVEDKKKIGKVEDENAGEQTKLLTVTEGNDSHDEKLEVPCTVAKKKCKEEKKKDTKLIKPDIKEGIKISVIKDKKSDRKKLLEKASMNPKGTLSQTKKDSKAKTIQKKGIPKKTVLAKKSHLTVVQKLVDKKIKLSKLVKDEETSVSEEDEAMKKIKRKNGSVSKSKAIQEKKPKLGKHMKAKLPSKSNKISAVLKKDDKLKTLVEKVVVKKKADAKETERTLNEQKKIVNKDESNEEVSSPDIKSELDEDREICKPGKEEQSQQKPRNIKKPVKSVPKVVKKIVKKKAAKVQMENNNQTFSSSEETSSEESGKQIKVCEESVNENVSSKLEEIDSENIVDTNLKDEPINGDNITGNPLSSDSGDESDDENKRGKQKELKKREGANSPSDERVRRMRLFGFWSGPKRHRVASLNALAKVHCLYENETGGVYLGGFCKPKPEKEKQKKAKEEKEEPQVRKDKEKKVETKSEENVSKRKLRNVPGLRGKHWDMLESSSSSSSSSDDECEREKSTEHIKKKIVKRRKKNEEVMDLKDMVVCKRMASLNASAILAASYSDEKNLCGSSSDSTSDSEVEIIKKRKQNDSDIEKRKSRQNSEQDEVLKPSNKLVIVNQDTDVTITGI